MFLARVPATSANLGPGFDAIGLAVDLQLEVRASLAPFDQLNYRAVASGDAADDDRAKRGRDDLADSRRSVPDSPDNLIHQGFRAVYAALGEDAPTVRFDVANPIPLARGLGSSSAALVAGAAIADAFNDGRLGRDEVFRLMAAFEGHPDNVAPAVYGGLTVAAADSDGAFVSASLPLPPGWRILFGVPDFELATSAARAVLPSHYGRAEVVLTSSRAALWVAAAALDRPELLRTASLDVLHQPYRERLVPGLAAASVQLRALGVHAAFLSGAGPTLGVVCAEEMVAATRAALADFVGLTGEVLELEPATGYTVQRC